MAEDDLKAKVDRHDRDISSIRSDVEHMSKAIDGVKSDTSRIFEKLDSALMTSRTSGTFTLANVNAALGVCVNMAILIAGVVGGIVYVAGNANSQETAVLSLKVDQIYSSYAWRPVVRREAEPPRN